MQINHALKNKKFNVISLHIRMSIELWKRAYHKKELSFEIDFCWKVFITNIIFIHKNSKLAVVWSLVVVGFSFTILPQKILYYFH
jgi:hypothetical protein